MDDDSLGGGIELIIINHTIIYHLKGNLSSTYLYRRGLHWVTEGSEIGFPTPGETGRHNAL
jgi:hypothetical protein